MTRTSTDFDVADDQLQNSDRQFDSPFRRGLAITISALIVLVCVFAGLNYLQGPKLSSARIDAARALLQPGQQLRLFVNQSIAAVKTKQVTVTPAVPFTVSTSGAIIAVQFSGRLDYATHYSVAVTGVKNTFQSRVSTFGYSFTTAPAQIYYLARADPASGQARVDSIIRAQVRGKVRRVVYSAPHIQQFAVFPQAIVVSTLTPTGSSALSLVSLNNGFVEQLQLPGDGTVNQLAASAEAGIVGFVFTSSKAQSDIRSDERYAETLMTVDLTATHLVTPVLDLASKPLAVTNWVFLAASSRIVAHTPDDTVLLFDGAKPGTVVPLGQFTKLIGGSPDGLRVVVKDIFGLLAYSLADGTKTRLPSAPLAGSATNGGDLALVGTGMTHVQQVTIFTPSVSSRYQTYLVYIKGTNSRILFETANQAGSIEGFSVSPNGQYLAVASVPDVSASVSDGYAVDPQSTSISTSFVDIQTGAIVSSVAGFETQW